jgi:putative SOS response-associated peptidase YedK
MQLHDRVRDLASNSFVLSGSGPSSWPAHDPATGEVADTYTVIITDANAVMRVHDRMPVILATDAERRWLEPGPLPHDLLAPYTAEEMQAWRISDAAKNSRIAPHAGMAEPVTG